MIRGSLLKRSLIESLLAHLDGLLTPASLIFGTIFGNGPKPHSDTYE